MFNKKKTDERPQEVVEQSSKGKVASVTEAVAAQSPEQPRMTIRYIDRPECAETFSDAINFSQSHEVPWLQRA